MNPFIFRHDGDLQNVVLATPFYATDNRGDFAKYYEKSFYADNGIKFIPHEIFITTSVRNVIRGMHFQTKNPQAKLVTVLVGAIYDVIIDLRSDSPSFGKWKGYELSAKNRCVLYVPKGFAHGFLAVDESNTVCYMCDAPYSKETDGGIVWNDHEIGIEWPLDRESPIVSEKDSELISFSEFTQAFGGF